MYLPAAFCGADDAAIRGVIRAHPFATLVTTGDDGPFATHLPLRLVEPTAEPGGIPPDANRLVGHVARANPQWQHFAAGREVLAIFHGPHAYVSPTWYETRPSVPTWNYVAVHVRGTVRLLEDPAAVRRELRELAATFEGTEPGAWTAELPEEYWQRMTRALVAFELEVTRWEGKFKLSQDKPPADARGVADALAASEASLDREVAALMRAARPELAP